MLDGSGLGVKHVLFSDVPFPLPDSRIITSKSQPQRDVVITVPPPPSQVPGRDRFEIRSRQGVVSASPSLSAKATDFDYSLPEAGSRVDTRRLAAARSTRNAISRAIL